MFLRAAWAAWIIGVCLLLTNAVHAQTDTPTPITVVVTVIVVPASATPTETPLPPTETYTPTVTPTPSNTPTVTPIPYQVVTLNDGQDGAASAAIVYEVSAGEFMIALVLFAIFATLIIQWILRLRGKG
jgi:hypothetical protein